MNEVDAAAADLKQSRAIITDDCRQQNDPVTPFDVTCTFNIEWETHYL